MLSYFEIGNLVNPSHRKQRRGQFKCFDLGKKMWMKLSNAAILPHNALLVVAGRSLYAVVGSDSDHPNEKGFFQYDAKQNRWKQLQSTIGIHEIKETQIVYLDGYIYVISNQYVERYNLAEQQWEALPSLLSSGYGWTSAVAYEGNVLVYGIGNARRVTHEIHQYNLSTNSWQIVLSQLVSSNVLTHPRPVLFEYQDQVYRIMYMKNESNFLFDNDIPVVDKLSIQSFHIDGEIFAELESVNQDLVAGSKIDRAFCIQDQVFVESKGFVLLTGLKMNHGVVDNPALERIWDAFGGHVFFDDTNNIVCFTLDKKKLGRGLCTA